MWSEAPAEISFTEGSVEASLLNTEESIEDNSAAASANASFTVESVDACSSKASAPAIVEAAAETDVTEAVKDIIEEATPAVSTEAGVEAMSTETISRTETGFAFAEAEVLGSGADATEADSQSAQVISFKITLSEKISTSFVYLTASIPTFNIFFLFHNKQTQIKRIIL